MNPTFDDHDQVMADICKASRNKRRGPRIGDFVDMPDGRTMRFSHDWGDDIQISEGGSYYLMASGGVSMSGGLEPAIDKAKLTKTRRAQPGTFWFFHHGHSRAHNGVYFQIPCRVYKYDGGVKLSDYRDPYTGKAGMPTYV